jgi:CubicO group peptidase (beta-lactamase class C family)
MHDDHHPEGKTRTHVAAGSQQRPATSMTASHAMARFVALIALIVGVSACDEPLRELGAITESANDLADIAPERLGDGWPTGTLADQGIEAAPMKEMLQRIRAGEYTGISSVLLARRGVLVVEEYFGAFGRDDLHSTRSAAKAITSALVGIAIDQGFIESVDVPTLPYFPEYEGEIRNWDDRKRDVTIAHLLTMTSGVRGNEDAMYPTDDWIRFYLDQPLAAAPGEAFSYATSGVVTLGNIITRASGLRIPAFADRYLFGPLGITVYRWPITNSRGNQGLAMTGGGLNLRPRDMLKFGQLYANGGVWQGKRLISESWIEASTRKHATSDLYGEDFGYLWRMIDRTVEGQQVRSFEAWGNGGQFIMVFPSLDLVAVFTGENYGLFPEMEQPFEMIDRYILPAVSKAGAGADRRDRDGHD